jgi:hypothetical protein
MDGAGILEVEEQDEYEQWKNPSPLSTRSTRREIGKEDTPKNPNEVVEAK